jgi:hypothetical protein
MDSLQDFFFTQASLPHASPNSGLSDRIITYDELIGRFTVGDQDVDFTAHVSNFLVAVLTRQRLYADHGPFITSTRPRPVMTLIIQGTWDITAMR